MRRPTLLALAASLALASPALGQGGPDTTGILGAAACELVAVVNGGDSAAVQRFVEARLSAHALAEQPTAAYAAQLLALGRQSGGVTLRGTEPLGQSRILTLWARRMDRGTLVHLAPDRQDSTRLGALHLFGPEHGGMELHLPAGARERALDQAIERELRRLERAGQLSGVLAVERGGRVRVLYAAGWADAARRIPNTPATRFHLASMGKMFTAVAVAQLVEARRLALDDTVSHVLPELPWHPVAGTITVRQLLEHTGGIGEADSAHQMLAQIAARAPDFPPGTRFSYSNEGYRLLAGVVARVSGESFEDYLRRHVFAPAGMPRITTAAAEEQRPAPAIGYGRRDDDAFAALPLVPDTAQVRGRRATGAGGEYASVDDLLRFARALRDGRLVSRAMLDTLTAPRHGVPAVLPGEQYGYGFMTLPVADRRIVGHGGGGMGWGICTSFFTAPGPTPAAAFTVVLLSNYDPPACELQGSALAEAMSRG
ncbi:MAG TPA: serine hydrolase domain-containing protein [Gemmatimonadales bacterium]|nr:serine hydrolase domain-containing protein [Gemmatimonadales bacterium]